MTGFNHALTGAVIAGLVKEPAVALPTAFASHFVIDALPHFGVPEEHRATFKRNQVLAFRVMIAIDVILFPLALVAVPIVLRPIVPVWLTLACMALAWLPDAFWVWRFINELRTKIEKPRNRFYNFHIWIQWHESPIGGAVELLWFAGMCGLLAYIKSR